MHRSISCLLLLLGVGELSAAPPAAPPNANAAGPSQDNSALPLPRAVPPPPALGAIVEELAPAPREQPSNSAGGPTPGPFREEGAPMPRPQTPPPPRLLMPSAMRGSSTPELEALRRQLDSLRLEREAMLVEEIDLITCRDRHAAKTDEDGNLRRRVTELLAKITQREKQQRAIVVAPPQPSKKEKRSPKKSKPSIPPTGDPAEPVPSTRPVQPHPQQPIASPKQPDNTASVVTDVPVDPLSLAQSLFRASDFAGALNVYRKLEQEEHKPEERAAVQYMMACCLRKLGKTDEASILYREVANSAADAIVVENAQWYLRAMKDRRQLETALEELRQRRQAVMPRKP